MSSTKSLEDIQKEIGSWAKEQFGNNESKDANSISYGYPLGSIPALLGMVEELGELARVVCRRHQGRAKQDAVQAQHDKADALADCLVFMCDFAHREDINLQVVLNLVWEKVCKRRQGSWAADKAKEQDVPLLGVPATNVAHATGKAVDNLRILQNVRDNPLKGSPTDEILEQDGHGFSHHPDSPT